MRKFGKKNDPKRMGKQRVGQDSEVAGLVVGKAGIFNSGKYSGSSV